MSNALQSLAADAIVLAAAAWLALRYLAGRRKPGCGGGCGCSETGARAKLAKPDRAARTRA